MLCQRLPPGSVHDEGRAYGAARGLHDTVIVVGSFSQPDLSVGVRQHGQAEGPVINGNVRRVQPVVEVPAACVDGGGVVYLLHGG